MHEDNKAKGRSMLHASRRRFVQGLAAVGTFGICRGFRHPQAGNSSS